MRYSQIQFVTGAQNLTQKDTELALIAKNKIVIPRSNINSDTRPSLAY